MARSGSENVSRVFFWPSTLNATGLENIFDLAPQGGKRRSVGFGQIQGLFGANAMNWPFWLDAACGADEMLRMNRKPQILAHSKGSMNWEPLLSNPINWKPGHSAMACAQCREDAVMKASSELPLEIS